MKITKSQLVNIIQEEMRKVHEQLHPTDDEIASDYVTEVGTGCEAEDDQWQS